MGSITVSNVGKAYKHYPNKWVRFVEWIGLPSAEPRHKLKWILQDINFTVSPGEAVGIIGMNGAGKSTLLKMITGTTQPSTGSVQMQGRVAALLELGMGFHPDFTGRQNAVMAGQLLGYSMEEISRLMPEIEAFAEIGEYIDQPVRVYSSGMQVRLAFSVATAIRPDILIVDEALSVGDVYFQHKSFERIRQYRKQGTTLLLVSHDKSAIQSICDRAILLDAGVLAMAGDPEAVMDFYNAKLADHQNQTVKQEVTATGKIQTISGTAEATIADIFLIDEEGRRIEVVDVGQPITLRVLVTAHCYIERLIFGYGIKDRLGQVVYGTNTDLTNQALDNVEAGSSICFDISFPANLGAGDFSIQTALCSTDTHLVNNYEWRDLALVFSVVNISKPNFVGVAWIDPIIRIVRT
ncbi:ABC transporter ATP-binding protein [Uliginosibacterium aquaticum]|uniref:ABC transporter ATP-binding protein n=1 Tax=Uliginosibacterium aquaticum TaxID=2731212 RepID=A0ABX2ICM6_9RHOO|nr:ABC transporter ATP-binding protein [Uliginosibacterium aquaticum]NSL53752.1 ABC transporter ATP-binding protein [Uliginosibacterium aquaticum]